MGKYKTLSQPLKLHKESPESRQRRETMQKDFLASNLRCQINRLQKIISNLEDSEEIDAVYINVILKQVEIGLRQIRK